VPNTSAMYANPPELATSFTMTIDGRAATSDRTFGVVNPATEAHLADAPDCSPSQLDEVMQAAARAYRTWRSDDEARRTALRAGADAMEAAASELARVLTAEQGKPLRDSYAEVETTARWFRWYADFDLATPQVVEDNAERHVAVHRRPLGVAVAIGPWNFPIQMAGKKAAQALRPGNTLVIKPSPYTPLSTLKFVEVLQPVFPPGVLSAVSGGDQLGAWLTQHPLTRKISFTGSTPVGKLIAAAAAPDLKRITLELGGNDAAIVLDDADPATVARGIFDRAFLNCGQTCAAIKRAYVHERLFDDVVGELAELARASVIGDGMDPRTDYGPLNNKAQLRVVSDLVDDALARGARAAAGAEPVDGPGYFYRPTILVNVQDGQRIVDEEQFGPALPVISYRDVEDAIDRANSGHLCLGGSVWTTDPDRGADLAGRLECGTAWVNTHAVTLPSAPFAGAKWSGVGVENGSWGLYDFTQVQAVHTAH
jgi:acyl-CoA reductase-like NAD-dependent aldehyde dehydrogenase